MSNLLIPTTQDELDNMLASYPTAVVDCFAPWCAPCKIIGPIFEKIASEQTDQTFIKVDIEQFPDFAKNQGIRNIPTILIFKQTPTARLIGFTSEQKLRDFIAINT